MKKLAILAAVICLFSLGALAQSKTNFAGNWELDVKKSKLPEMMRIEAMTMKVTQTDKELTVETATKRMPPPEGAAGGGMGGRGGGGGRGGFGGDGTVTYSLDGKEKTIQQDSPMGQVPVTLLAKSDAGKLKLNSSRKINSPMGEVSVTSEETWELVDEGKTLKVVRTTASPRGTQTMEMYFAKKQ
jgi:hypothetical protein